MNIKKFNEKMSRPKYSKGGYIKKIAGRKYFDAGGTAIPPTISSGSSTSGAGTGGTNTAQGLAQNASNLLGTNAVAANLTPGSNAAQLNAAYNNAQSGLTQQQNLVNTLTPQAQTGVNAQNTVQAQELAEAQGSGPNPALTELATTTGTNVGNEAALLAGQRGSNANVGLAGRNIGQQGAATEQGAVGQAATLEAQQSLAAQQAAAGIAANQIGQTAGATTGLNTADQNEQSTLENANTSLNNANVAQQSNLNNVNSANNSNILSGIGNLALNIPVVGSLFAKGGEVGAPNPHGKHKLEFIHKMAKMGMEHYDQGTPNGPVVANVQAKQDSLRNAFHTAPSAEAAPPSTSASPSPAPTSSQGSQNESARVEASRKLYRNTYGEEPSFADGGSISANPLLAAIQNQSPQAANYSAQYNQGQASSGPAIDNSIPQLTPFGTNAADKNNSSPTMGTSSNSTNPNITGANSSLVQSGQADVMAPGYTDTNLAMNTAYKGGEMHSHFDKHFANYFADGGGTGEVPAMVSPKERYWEPEEVEQIKHGANPFKLGRVFPGKDKVPGKDTLKNDTLPVTLREGGIVNPLHIEKTKNPDKARLFVLKSLKATGKHMKKPKGA